MVGELYRNHAIPLGGNPQGFRNERITTLVLSSRYDIYVVSLQISHVGNKLSQSVSEGELIISRIVISFVTYLWIYFCSSRQIEGVRSRCE